MLLSPNCRFRITFLVTGCDEKRHLGGELSELQIVNEQKPEFSITDTGEKEQGRINLFMLNSV